MDEILETINNVFTEVLKENIEYLQGKGIDMGKIDESKLIFKRKQMKNNQEKLKNWYYFRLMLF